MLKGGEEKYCKIRRAFSEHGTTRTRGGVWPSMPARLIVPSLRSVQYTKPLRESTARPLGWVPVPSVRLNGRRQGVRGLQFRLRRRGGSGVRAVQLVRLGGLDFADPALLVGVVLALRPEQRARVRPRRGAFNHLLRAAPGAAAAGGHLHQRPARVDRDAPAERQSDRQDHRRPENWGRQAGLSTQA